MVSPQKKKRRKHPFLKHTPTPQNNRTQPNTQTINKSDFLFCGTVEKWTDFQGFLVKNSAHQMLANSNLDFLQGNPVA